MPTATPLATRSAASATVRCFFLPAPAPAEGFSLTTAPFDNPFPAMIKCYADNMDAGLRRTLLQRWYLN